MTTQVAEMRDRLEAFSSWLVARGAELMTPVADVELLRFKTPKGVSCVTAKKTGAVTFVGEAATAWKAYRNNETWRAVAPTKRNKTKLDIPLIRKRDGDLCFYCREHVSQEDESAEHLVPLTHGGPDHLSNKFLAHRICNSNVGHFSATEKIRIHVNAVMRKAAEKMKEGL